eukprot:693728-Amphidinium_carterae.1
MPGRRNMYEQHGEVTSTRSLQLLQDINQFFFAAETQSSKAANTSGKSTSHRQWRGHPHHKLSRQGSHNMKGPLPHRTGRVQTLMHASSTHSLRVRLAPPS